MENLSINQRKAINAALSILLFLSITLFGAVSCKSRSSAEIDSDLEIIKKAISEKRSLYYANYRSYPSKLRSLPIGMFDSGTGGLTVMEQFLAMDLFNNVTGEEGGDGIPDFAGEDFIYLADQANMPYGVYPSQSKREYLRELVVKDALFLTTEPNRSKLVVIACNTATAYGFKDVELLLNKSKTGVGVIGVIDSGTEGAFSKITQRDTSFAIGVLATVGTVMSGGYEQSIKRYAVANFPNSDVRVVSQGGAGFAESIDSEPDYISSTASTARANYRGPLLGDSAGINPSLMHIYNFDKSGNSLLISRDKNGEIDEIQLNSTGNYARFHMVSLIERHRLTNPGVKMKSIILGCTHYPYLSDTLKKVLNELYDHKKDGEYPYREVLEKDIEFVDPALNTAKKAFKHLHSSGNLKLRDGVNKLFAYISVPHKDLTDSLTDGAGNLTFAFKYGRETGSEDLTVSIVSFSKENIKEDNRLRIKERLPLTYSLLKSTLE